MPTVNEEVTTPRIHSGRRESVTGKVNGSQSVGDMALMDGLVIIAICWLIVFGSWFSLRNFNV